MPLPPPVSPAARQMMHTAFKDLEKIISPDDSRGFSDSTIQKVREAALDIEKQLAARQCLRNMRRLMPLFQGLEHYSKVMDVVCNGTPFLPWIWAPISLILRVSAEYVEAFGQIVKAYSRLAESLKRFAVLGEALASNADFQQTLAVFYADILQFHGHAYKFVRRSGWKLFFMTSWGRFQSRFNGILEDMQRHEDLIDGEANAYNIAETQKMHHDIQQWREDSKRKLTADEAEQTAKQFESILTWLKVDEADQLSIFESISTSNIQDPGTCSWILQNVKIKSWLRRTPDPPILWMKGTPGLGKSVLATKLVEFMRNAGMTVACHFCTYSYASSMTYEQILRSLLSQLVRKDDDLVAHVYTECVLEKKTPTVTLLEKLLHTLVGSLSTIPNQVEYVWILLDGLDECDNNKQARIINLMKQITAKFMSSGNVICKVLVSSRPSNNLSERLRKSDTISLSDEKESLDHAIKQYANIRLQLMHEILDQLYVGPEFDSELADIIAKKSDGMFLYARLVLDFVSSNLFYDGQEIKDSVNQLPDELAKFYQKILTGTLRNKDQRSVDRIRCILGWIAFSKRPLKKLEFMSAVTFSSGNPTVEHLVPQYIFNSIDTLVEERRDTTMSFIHVSVKDFLQSPRSLIPLNEAEATNEHGIATITCLLSGLHVFSNEYPERSRFLRLIEGVHGFHIYATEYWTEYILAHAASMVTVPGTVSSSRILSLALQFAAELELISSGLEQEGVTLTGEQPFDDRVLFLQQYTRLKNCVVRNLRARSLKKLESDLTDQPFADETQRPLQQVPVDGVSAMLATYQESLRFLLEKDEYPGIPAMEFERFKSQFRTAAFTCRLASCPRATMGFSTAQLFWEHEKSHVHRFPCTAPGCQYPPFSSARTLQNHTRKFHQPEPPRESIRTRGDIVNISKLPYDNSIIDNEDKTSQRPSISQMTTPSTDESEQSAFSTMPQVIPAISPWGEVITNL